MAEECTHDCSSCGKSCGERTKESFLEAQNEASDIKKVIGIVSGKGGVGKSMVTSLLATYVRKAGKEVAILDADITGPSIPKAFGLREQAVADEKFLQPVLTETGIKTMSMNLLLPDETDPVVWRGPVIAGAVKQFWTDVAWGNVDYMFVDMPPGTGDVPLTVFQSLPLAGIVIVTSPQDLVSMVVEKAVKMAGMMDVPVLSLVENMSYFVCPDCGKQHEIYGPSHAEDMAARFGIDTVSRLPINPLTALQADIGKIEDAEVPAIENTVQKILGM